VVVKKGLEFYNCVLTCLVGPDYRKRKRAIGPLAEESLSPMVLLLESLEMGLAESEIEHGIAEIKRCLHLDMFLAPHLSCLL